MVVMMRYDVVNVDGVFALGVMSVAMLLLLLVVTGVVVIYFVLELIFRVGLDNKNKINQYCTRFYFINCCIVNNLRSSQRGDVRVYLCIRLPCGVRHVGGCAGMMSHVLLTQPLLRQLLRKEPVEHIKITGLELILQTITGSPKII